MKTKKSQVALEFMLILGIIIIIILGLSVYIMSYSKNLIKNKEEVNIQNYFTNINKEVEILNYVENGYTRKIEIPLQISNNYNISIEKNHFILKSKVQNLTFYNNLDTNYSVNISNKTIINNNYFYITFKK